MEIAQLRALMALKTSSSLTAAGRDLGLSTSAIFCQIKQLEDEVGRRLYQKIGKMSRLTETGELLSRYAQRIVAQHDYAVSSIHDGSSNKRQVLRVGCGPNSSVLIVPHLLRAFLADHTRTDVRITTSGDTVLLRDLRAGALDLVFMSLPAGEPDLLEEPLFSYEMVLTSPPGSGRSAECVRRLKAQQLPFILFRRSVVTKVAFQQFCANLGIEPNVVVESDEPDSIRRMVKLGLGMTVLPTWSVVEDRRRRRLSTTRLKHGSYHNYGMLSRRAGYQSRAVSEMMTVARQWRAWWPLAESVGEPL